jgi:nitrite reductase (NO-forming)
MRMISTGWMTLLALLFTAAILAGCTSAQAKGGQNPVAAGVTTGSPAPQSAGDNLVVKFGLRTQVGGGRIVYVGVGGDIDGVTNPDLHVPQGSTVQVLLTNGDGMQHDLFFPDFDARSDPVIGKGDQVELVFQVTAGQLGNHVYYCTFPGHRQAGQEGKLVVDGP